MNRLRRNFERFCYKHRNKGIPNLMLYVVLGSGITMLLQILGLDEIYSLLIFNRDMILKGQIWRLFSYVFTMSSGNIFFTLILLYCVYSLGGALEQEWGTFRFNLYYLSTVLIMDLFAMLFGGVEVFHEASQIYVTREYLNYYYAGGISSYLHLSLLLCYATVYPEARFTVFFVIPIRARVLALVYLIITAIEVVSATIPTNLFPHNLFPLVALASYFLFFGKDIIHVLPLSMQRWFAPRRKKQTVQTGTSAFVQKQKSGNYTHRCTICGKTDVTDPQMEFRYCSRCNGYFCYCQEHINNHTHAE